MLGVSKACSLCGRQYGFVMNLSIACPNASSAVLKWAIADIWLCPLSQNVGGVRRLACPRRKTSSTQCTSMSGFSNSLQATNVGGE